MTTTPVIRPLGAARPPGPASKKRKAESDPAAARVDAAARGRTAPSTQRPQRPKGGTTGVEVSPSAETADHTAHGSAGVKKSGDFYEYKEIVRWKGKRWEFRLNVPIHKSVLTSAEIQALRPAINKARDVFLQDLQKRSPGVGKEDFEFVLTENGYAVYKPTDDQHDYDSTSSLEENVDAGNIQVIVDAKDGPAKKISTLLQSAKPNLAEHINSEIDKDPELRELYNLFQRAKTAPAKGAVPLRPVGFTNPKNYLCYLNAAVQQWATNPVIRAELLKPGVIQDGESNPLHKILTAYEQAQHSDTQTSSDLEELRAHLGFEKNVQMDEQEAMQRLNEQIDFSKVSPNSPIYSRSKAHKTNREGTWDAGKEEAPELARRTIAPKGASVAAALKEQQASKLDSDGKAQQVLEAAPGVLVAHVNRDSIQYTELPDAQKDWLIDRLKAKKADSGLFFDDTSGALFAAEQISPENKRKLALIILSDESKFETARALVFQHSDKLSDEEKKAFIDQLVDKGFPASLLDEVDRPKLSKTTSDAEKIALANKILNNKKIASALLKILKANEVVFSKVLKAIADTETEKSDFSRKIPHRKDTTELLACDERGKMTLDGELYGNPGQTTVYDLMSFSLHHGTGVGSGHYVTYVKDGNTCWCLNDDKRPEKVDEAEFYRLAKTAYVLIYNKEGLTPAPSADAPKPAKTDEGLKDQESLGTHGDIQIVAGVGDLTRRSGAVIVNYTDETLRRKTAILDAANVADELRKKREEKKGYFGLHNKQGLYAVGDAVSTDAGRLDKVEGIIHIVTPELTGEEISKKDDESIRKAVRAALKEAQKKGQAHVAFGLLNDTATALNKALYVLLIGEISAYAKDHHKDITPLRIVEIVLSQAQREAFITKPVEAPQTTPPDPSYKAVKTINNGPVTFEVGTTQPDATPVEITAEAYEIQVKQQLSSNTTGEITFDLRGLPSSIKAAEIVHDALSVRPPRKLKVKVILPEGDDAKVKETIAALGVPLKPYTVKLGSAQLEIQTAKPKDKARKEVTPKQNLEALKSVLKATFDDVGIPTLSTVTFDFRGKQTSGQEASTDGTTARTHSIDYRDFGANPAQVAEAFQTALAAFLQKRPDLRITFKVILPEDDTALQRAFQKIDIQKLKDSVVDATRPATYKAIMDNGSPAQVLSHFKVGTKINDADVFVDMHNHKPKPQTGDIKPEASFITDVGTYLESLTEGTLDHFDRVEEVIFDLRPRAEERLGLGGLEGHITHPIFHLGNYAGVGPLRALDMLLEKMGKIPFMNPHKKRIRILLPLIEIDRVKIQQTLTALSHGVRNEEARFDLGPHSPNTRLILHSAPQPKRGTKNPNELRNKFTAPVTSPLTIDLTDYTSPTAALQIFQDELEKFARTNPAAEIRLIYPSAIQTQVGKLYDFINNDMLVECFPTVEEGRIRHNERLGSCEYVVVSSKRSRGTSVPGTKTEKQLTETVAQLLTKCDTEKFEEITIDLRPGVAGSDVPNQTEKKFLRSIDAREYRGNIRSAVEAAIQNHKKVNVKKVILILSDDAVVRRKPIVGNDHTVAVEAEFTPFADHGKPKTFIPNPLTPESILATLQAHTGRTVDIDLRKQADQQQALANFRAALTDFQNQRLTSKTTIRLILPEGAWTEEQVKAGLKIESPLLSGQVLTSVLNRAWNRVRWQ